MAENRTCPSCGTIALGESNFCEACGTSLSSSGPAAQTSPASLSSARLIDAAAGEPSPIDDLGSGPISRATTQTSPAEVTRTAIPPCASCGGDVGPDGYCEQCGVKALSPRDHFREQASSWVAGVCDKGIRHHRNEDAMALVSTPAGTASDRRAVLVVLDGVSNTDDSQAGSLAGAKAALGALLVPLPRGMGTPDGVLAAVTRALSDAVSAANVKVSAAAPEDGANPASATFCAAVVEGETLTYANVGDSRIYWLPDGEAGVQLSVDDSVAQAQMEAGVPRAEAESSPQAHAITKWLGRDSHDHSPRVGQLRLATPGWLLVCSDGLWNYASEPAALSALISGGASAEPAALALSLTDFANASGGQDNITVTLARIEPITPSPDTVHNADQTSTTKEQPHG